MSGIKRFFYEVLLPFVLIWSLCGAMGQFQQMPSCMGGGLEDTLKLCQFFHQAHTRGTSMIIKQSPSSDELKELQEGPGTRPPTGLFPQPTLLSAQREASKHTRLHPLQKYSFCISFACFSTFISPAQPITAFAVKTEELEFSWAFTLRMISQADQSYESSHTHTHITCFSYVILVSFYFYTITYSDLGNDQIKLNPFTVFKAALELCKNSPSHPPHSFGFDLCNNIGAEWAHYVPLLSFSMFCCLYSWPPLSSDDPACVSLKQAAGKLHCNPTQKSFQAHRFLLT